MEKYLEYMAQMVLLISYNNEECQLKFIFLIEINDGKYMAEYKFKLRNNKAEDKIEVNSEHLKYSEVDIINKKLLKSKSIINFNMNDSSDTIFKPIQIHSLLLNSNEGNKTKLYVSKELAKEYSISFIFNKRSIKLFQEGFKNENQLYSDIIMSLQRFAQRIFIIKNNYSGCIEFDAILPLYFSENSSQRLDQDIRTFSLFHINRTSLEAFNVLNEVMKTINIVLKSIIPGLEIQIEIISEELLENAEIGKVFQFISIRNKAKIPLKYESHGIRKIILILSAFVAMYNSEKTCIVIDQLDSEVFEFLFGELLSVLKERAKGQLIFTAHNLRALEVLEKDDIIITTTNSNNRYVKLKNIKKNNNLIDYYLQELFLGGQNKKIYSNTKSYVIGRAFRKTGMIH